MADLPARPPAGLPPLPPGWSEHKAPTGHTYYYNRDTGKSTYTRPVVPIQTLHRPVFAPAPAPATSSFPNVFPTQDTFNAHHPAFNFGAPYHGGDHRGGHRDGHRGAHRGGPHHHQPKDRPKHRTDIPNCAPWVLVRTKLGRRFVWNKDTNESFWKFPPDVMKAVIEMDRRGREKKERRERGEPSSDEGEGEREDVLAEVEAELAVKEDEIRGQIVEVEGEEGMEGDSEYEEVEVTDDEGEEGGPSKRQRTEEPSAQPEGSPQPMELGEDDLSWQLAQMEALENGHAYYEGGEGEEEEEGLPLTEEDCQALFRELLDDMHMSPYTPWEKVLENTALYDDDRYKALPNMRARKECFDAWSRDRIAEIKAQRAQQAKRDPKIPYLDFLHRYATSGKLYWQEFQRKYRKEPEMKDYKLPDKEKEKLYREHVKRLAMRLADREADLKALLQAQPLGKLNNRTTLDTLPDAVRADLRFISLPGPARDSLVERFISTLPPPPEDAQQAGLSEEQQAELAKKKAERERRERALREREDRVREERRRLEREAAFGREALREGEEEIQRAMRLGKEGLRGRLEGEE
ncbi:uncharacterized protein EI97DRAFT_227251 [Westerdykella ornata]|uniref:WW domain-containing protein n=1 Tax=Westerdykella ornata TaxID=318751 RepID=A0A6A6JRA6_WESOR|nr:uncharacterized protein EI97DRAFT_227251 [Westerdykella ornata]KAF2279082.1 hypothetical protein EI97DRAFT_227251 [Westerdykella ornata]